MFVMAKSENFVVAGVSHYVDNIINNLVSDNPDYGLSNKELIEQYDPGERIFEYDFGDKDVALVPEPENPHDPNAIRVEVRGILIGYIKAGSCSHVKNLLNSPDFAGMDLTIGGGKFKRVYEDEDDNLKVENDSTGFFADLTIYTRQASGDPSPAAAAPSYHAPAVGSVPPAAPPKKKDTLSIVLIVIGVMFLIGGINGFSIAVSNGIIGLVIGGVCLFFGIKRRMSHK